MQSWPPTLDPELFLSAAAVMETWHRAGDLRHHCCLRALAAAGSAEARWVDVHYSRAFFTQFFRPVDQSSNLPWWPESEYEARKIALCLAAAMASSTYS